MTTEQNGRITVAGESAARSVSAALLRWATGSKTADRGRTVLLSRADQLAAIASVLQAGDTVLAPDATDVHGDADPRVLVYDGAFDSGGDAVSVTDSTGSALRVERQSYLAIAFLPVTAPTIVTLDDDEGFDAFLEDADAVRAHGAILPQLLHPAVEIAGFDAVLEQVPEPASSIDVDTDGTVRAGADGMLLGSIHNDPASLRTALAQPLVAAGRWGRFDRRDGAIAERPWLPLYRHAVTAAKRTEQAAPWSVSGLGRMLNPAIDPAGFTAAHAMVLWSESPGVGSEYRIVETATRRRFSTSRQTALTVEALLAAGTIEGAAELLCASGALGRPDSVAELLERFVAAGVDLQIGPEA